MTETHTSGPSDDRGSQRRLMLVLAAHVTVVAVAWTVCGPRLWHTLTGRHGLDTVQTACLVAILCLWPLIGGSIHRLRWQLQVRSTYADVLLTLAHAVASAGTALILLGPYGAGTALLLTCLLFLPFMGAAAVFSGRLPGPSGCGS